MLASQLNLRTNVPVEAALKSYVCAWPIQVDSTGSPMLMTDQCAGLPAVPWPNGEGPWNHKRREQTGGTRKGVRHSRRRRPISVYAHRVAVALQHSAKHAVDKDA